MLRELHFLLARYHQSILILSGIVIHVLILGAAFEIYFSSPIDQGMTPVKSTANPVSNRLVLIVADGLRADAVFGKNENLAPNLNLIKNTRGSWGISHTRVPTESRPGHVALLAGIYEDPSAILKGWKVNPVYFDSVINQSTNAYCWGGPSVINMFNKGNQAHIRLHSYDPELEDFGNNNTIGLDEWVYEKVSSFIAEHRQCQSCSFHNKGNFFFLHLLGMDTAGHGFKPHSELYNLNLKYVDDLVPKIEKLFEAAFDDLSTTYVFTSDHGMTDWGSHGAGSDDETKTPFIVWGSGIRIDAQKKDIRQIDAAPLMSAIIGLNYPINSLGRIPVDYIDASDDALAEMKLSNIQQITETFYIKKRRRETNALWFVPFQGLEDTDFLHHLEYLKSSGEFDGFHIESDRILDLLIKGIDYYHNYYQLPLLISITIGMVAWILLIITFNIEIGWIRHYFNYYNELQMCLAIPLYALVVFVVQFQALPFVYYFYFTFPIIMVQILLSRYHYLVFGLRAVGRFGYSLALTHIAVYVVGVGLLIYTFRVRGALTGVMFFLSGFTYWSKQIKNSTTRSEKMGFIISCLFTSLLQYFPVLRSDFDAVIYLVGYAVWAKGLEKITLPYLEPDPSNEYIKWQFRLFTATPIYVFLVEYGLVPAFLKSFALLYCLVPILMVFFVNLRMFSRLTSIVLAFSPYYMMVTYNYENLFMFGYICTLFYWIKLESKSFGHASMVKQRFNGRINGDSQTSEDIRRAFFFCAIIFMGFFGSGNSASINSFDPMWVRCFITEFSPFTMTALIILKITIPFIFATCFFRAINLLRRGNTFNLFCIVLMFSDVILLFLLYCITNIGSWLEIGMSLSQFIVMDAFVLILSILYGFAYLLTTTTFNYSKSALVN